MAERDTMLKQPSNNKVTKDYLVVHFNDPLFANVDAYFVCVPSIWMKYPMNDNTVIIAYPSNEASSVTKERVKNREPCNDDWLYYAVEIKFQSNNFNDADRWLAARNYAEKYIKEELQQELDSELQERQSIKRLLLSSNSAESSKRKRLDDIKFVDSNFLVTPGISKNETVLIPDHQVANETAASSGGKNVSEQYSQSLYPKQFKTELSPTLSISKTGQNKVQNRSASCTAQIRTPTINYCPTTEIIPNNEVGKIKETAASSGDRSYSAQNAQYQYPKQHKVHTVKPPSSSSIVKILQNIEQNLIDKRTAQHILPAALNCTTREVYNAGYQTDERTTTKPLLTKSNFQNTAHHSSSGVVNQEFMDKHNVINTQALNETISNINEARTDIKNSFDMSDEPRIELMQGLLNDCGTTFGIDSIYYKTIEQIIAFARSTNTALSSSTKSTNPPQVSKENQTTAAERPEQCKNSKQRSIALSPEYHPNNTRWTLKYQKLRPGLVELETSRDIYVSYVELQYSKQISKNCCTLLRRLLTEIFSESALSVCKLEIGNDDTDNCLKPILDTQALKVLMNFVLKHGHEYNWKNVSKDDMMRVIKFEMQDIREKEIRRNCFNKTLAK